MSRQRVSRHSGTGSGDDRPGNRSLDLVWTPLGSLQGLCSSR